MGADTVIPFKSGINANNLPENWYLVYSKDLFVARSSTMVYNPAYQTNHKIDVAPFNKIAVFINNGGVAPCNAYFYKDSGRTQLVAHATLYNLVEIDTSDLEELYLYTTNCGHPSVYIQIVAIE